MFMFGPKDMQQDFTIGHFDIWTKVWWTVRQH